MTIYGTPGGTPLNQTAGFQGTQPGNPVGASLQQQNPGVGLFPPNSNTQGGDTVLAAISRGALPINAIATNAGLKQSGPGRSIAESMSDGDETGYGGSAGGFDSLNSDANGGAGPGAGQANQTEGPTSGESSFIEGSAPANAVTVTAAPNYAG